MGNFLEEQARQAHIEKAACEGVRIIRCDELTRLQCALNSATDALMRAKPTERVAVALAEVSDAGCLIGTIALTDDRKPPAELAEQLEAQTHLVPY